MCGVKPESNNRLPYPPMSPYKLTANGGTGILTCLPSLTPANTARLGLEIDLPWADEPSPGNRRFSADKILTCLFATYADILTSISSIPPYDDTSTYNRTLPYQSNAPHWKSKAQSSKSKMRKNIKIFILHLDLGFRILAFPVRSTGIRSFGDML